MESTEQTLRSYKNLVLKNKSTLASLSKFISTEKQLFPKKSSHGFQLMKQQYDQALVVSKASIDRNVQLQGELQFKQEKLKALREKYYRHFEEIQGLQFQMKRVTGQLKKQLKNRQESSRIILSNEKIKKDVEKLNKKKTKLEQQQGQLALKEKVKRQTIAKIQLEIQESQRRFLQQQKAQASKIQKLQQQISRQQSIIYSLKRQQRSFTPPKSTGKFDELLLKIQHQKSNLQD